MPSTTNFGWTTPADTDYVKDGALAIRTLGNGIDTSLVDLKGGTTGQILSKASNTDLDYTWINNDQGDITGVTASSPLTGGGTSGAVTVGIQDGTTAQKGAVQLEDSTSSTSTTTAAVPASVKSAYDLANAAIPKSLVDAAGDLIYATANDTPARLALGTAGQVLTVNAGATAPEWKTAAGGSTFAGCSVRQGSALIANNTTTVLDYTVEVFDTDNYHSNTTNPSRITIPAGKAGYYLIIAKVEWNTNAGGSNRQIRLNLNGTNIKNNIMDPDGDSPGPQVQTVRNLAEGDYLTVSVYQDSGGDLDVYATATQEFSIAYIGAAP